MSDTPNRDGIHRFLLEGTDIRGEIVTLEKSFQEALAGQHIPSELAPLFGEFLAATALISDMLKQDGLVTLQARGDGAVPLVMAEASHRGELRGVLRRSDEAQPHTTQDTLSALPLSELVGNGVLTLILDPEQGKRYQGIVPLSGASLSECITTYFEQSEQLPTLCILFTNDERCGGLFLQALPAQEVTDPDERAEQWATASQLLNTVKSEEFFATPHSTLLYRLFHEQGCRLFDEKPLRFLCSCSRDRSEAALIALGRKEMESLIEEQGQVTIDCQFCGTRYEFSEDQLNGLLAQCNTLH